MDMRRTHLQDVSSMSWNREYLTPTEMIPILLRRELRPRLVAHPVPKLRRLSLELARFILGIDPVVNAFLVVGLERCQKLTINSLGNFHGPSLTDMVAANPRDVVVGFSCAARSFVREIALSIYNLIERR